MIILTCADGGNVKTDAGRDYKNFKFSAVIRDTEKAAKNHNYRMIVYDLGQLGFGIPYEVEDESFHCNGYYETEVIKGYKSKSLFKPDIVQLSMDRYNETIAYLDGDAQLLGCLDEIETDDYDIGVTLRDFSELSSEWHQTYMDIARYINAGVIFFRPTDAAREFIELWKKETADVGNDQMALNRLACSEDYPDVDSIQTLHGVRIKYFPGNIYNFYYFTDNDHRDAKILHFKGAVRHFYPFDWKKRVYCRAAVPVKNGVNRILRRRVDLDRC
ncbi:MAG: hypothetical protein C0618_04910 [Desulfuromonas sp.]|nr:MAG: hypothetical protein C0618_04910 [Desulfuromonas sp.]